MPKPELSRDKIKALILEKMLRHTYIGREDIKERLSKAFPKSMPISSILRKGKKIKQASERPSAAHSLALLTKAAN